MPAEIIDGKAIAADIRNEVSEGVAAFTSQYGSIKLTAILVGSDHGSLLYAESQRKRCLQAGVQYELVELPADASQRQLLDVIDGLNADPETTGIMLQMPLPEHLDANIAQYRIDPYKDVEGVSPANIGWLFYGEPIIAPCTALAVLELTRRSGLQIRGCEAVVVGQSRIVGRPITTLLGMEMATVTSCHIETRDLHRHTRLADLLVVAVGKAHLIHAEHVKSGATVIDVGINKLPVTEPDGSIRQKTVGDVDFESVAPIARAITPVPGGVGPVTVMMLLRNTVEAARKQRERKV